MPGKEGITKEKKHWYVVYTMPRSEKKVFSRLVDRGWEAYCPLQKQTKQWSDRTKIVEEPLFKSYLFVHISEADQPAIRLIQGVVNFVYWLGKPAKVRNEEIVRIQRFLDDYSNVQLEQLDEVQEGASVLITGGAFMEKEAKVVRIYSKKVELVIHSLGCKLVAWVDKEKIKRLP
jgi:transcription antitermination factor NusG